MNGKNHKLIEQESILIHCYSVVLLNSAASTEQVDPSTVSSDKNITQGVSGEWVKVVQSPGIYSRYIHVKY